MSYVIVDLSKKKKFNAFTDRPTANSWIKLGTEINRRKELDYKKTSNKQKSILIDREFKKDADAIIYKEQEARGDKTLVPRMVETFKKVYQEEKRKG